jgi:lambda family phage minor tail protein L
MSSSESNLNKQLFTLTPDTLVDLYEIDFSNFQSNFEELRELYGINLGAEPVYRFCSMINGTNPIIWQGHSYQPLPIRIEGFEKKSDGTLPRPKMRIANPEGLFSRILYSNGDFINCQVTRKRTFVRFLDEENFNNKSNPFGDPDPAAEFDDDVFFINRKTSEDKQFIEFELVSVLELEDAFVPARIILSDYCNWTYRCDIGCGYKGLAIENSDGKDLTKGFGFNGLGGIVSSSQYENADDIPEWSKNKPEGYSIGDLVKVSPLNTKNPYKKTISVFVCSQGHADPEKHHPFLDRDYWLRDECTKTLSSCKKRFESEELKDFNKKNLTYEGLRFGGFPGTEKYSIE